MPTEDFIIELFCQVDDKMLFATKHSQAMFFPSEVVTIALLFALKGCGNRAFYRWLKNNWRHFFPSLPHRTRVFRLFNTHRHWIDCFRADPSLIGVIDSYGIELIHPRREGRSPKQIGKKGLSNKRWIIGGKLCLLLNHLGLIVAWLWTRPKFTTAAPFNTWLRQLPKKCWFLPTRILPNRAGTRLT